MGEKFVIAPETVEQFILDQLERASLGKNQRLMVCLPALNAVVPGVDSLAPARSAYSGPSSRNAGQIPFVASQATQVPEERKDASRTWNLRE
jgi:hypothetical protein